jgi:hypothetical protein
LPSHRSSRHVRTQLVARKSADDIMNLDNSASEYTALASVHELATDSNESNISGSDFEDIEENQYELTRKGRCVYESTKYFIVGKQCVQQKRYFCSLGHEIDLRLCISLKTYQSSVPVTQDGNIQRLASLQWRLYLQLARQLL